MADDLCQCPKCGRMHRDLGFGKPPESISSSVPDVVREWEATADNYLKRDPLRLAGNLMRDELTRMAGELKRRQELDNVTTLGVPGEATYPAPDHGWTCFHCGQTFPTAFLAEQHFGRFPKGTPACRFKGDFDLLEKLRVAESQLAPQAKTIEGLETSNLKLHEEVARTGTYKEMCEADLLRAEATVTELRAEVASAVRAAETNASIILEVEARATAAEAEVERLTGALMKVNAIRDSIIGLQKLNWSEHVYPLVAALGQAGIEGLPYPEAKANVGTLIERATTAESALETARGGYARVLDDMRNEHGRAEAMRAAFEVLFPDPVKNADGSWTTERADLELEGALEDVKRGKADKIVVDTLMRILIKLNNALAALPSPPITTEPKS